MQIAILALQGAFQEHGAALDALDASHFEIRQRKDLDRPFDGLILPGGESTVMRKLLLDLELFHPLKARIQEGLPVFGTCAGLILLARDVEGGASCFGTMPIVAHRNAYGRQLGSFHTKGEFGTCGAVPMTFIRAPYISDSDQEVEILSTVNGKAVAAQFQNQLVTAFHPELTKDCTVHAHFLQLVSNTLPQKAAC
jgi:5'-phosphate synthase pdxT subunit